MVRVHISLTRDFADDPARRAAVRASIEAITPLLDVDERRFERHGLLTATIASPALIAGIEGLLGVLAVEPDAERRAL